MHLVHRGPWAQVNLGGAAVERSDTVVPQPVEHVGVAAVAEARLGTGLDDFGVKVRHDRDLVLAADGREHRSDLRAGERGVEVGSPALRRRAQPTRRGVLDRHEPVILARRSMACSCTSGAKPGAANDGESTATLSPGAALGA